MSSTTRTETCPRPRGRRRVLDHEDGDVSSTSRTETCPRPRGRRRVLEDGDVSSTSRTETCPRPRGRRRVLVTLIKLKESNRESPTHTCEKPPDLKGSAPRAQQPCVINQESGPLTVAHEEGQCPPCPPCPRGLVVPDVQGAVHLDGRRSEAAQLFVFCCNGRHFSQFNNETGLKALETNFR